MEKIVSSRNWSPSARALDFGCGNGSLTRWLAEKGFSPVGVDISESGIEIAKRSVPAAEFSGDISIENLSRLGPFDLVLCMEVIAHCYTPSSELEKFFQCLRPGGTLLLSTPYHGYFKNLAMAATGSLQRHLDTRWPGAYVHFFSVSSITTLLHEAGFQDVSVARLGRIPPLAKSMVITCSKPL